MNAVDFLATLFSEYDQHGVEYCLLRNYESLPERLDSRDVDILLSSAAKRNNRHIISSLAKKYGAVIYNHYQDERFEQIYLFCRISPHDFKELKLDFFFDSELYGVRLVDGEEILRSRVKFRNFYIAGDAYKVSDKWLFTYLLGAPLPEKYHSEFKDIFIRNRKALGILLSKIFGKSTGEKLVSHVCTKGFTDLPRVGKGRSLLILLRMALKDPFYHAWHVPHFFYFRLKHAFKPKGEFISVSGPDGSGKTTILGGGTKQLERLFGSHLENHGHFRPNVLPRIADIAKRVGAITTVDEEFDSPHRGQPSGFIGSFARFTYYLLDYLCGYFIRIRPVLVRRELVVYDRYYLDMVADPGRSRISLPLWIRNLGLRILPLPATAFFVHVSADVARERKQELPVEKIEQLNADYLKLAESKRLLILENESSAEDAIARLVDAVIDRRRKRFKLDSRF